MALALPGDPRQLTQSMCDGHTVIKRHAGNSQLFSGPFCSQRDSSPDTPLLGLALNQSPDPPSPGKERETPFPAKEHENSVGAPAPAGS